VLPTLGGAVAKSLAARAASFRARVAEGRVQPSSQPGGVIFLRCNTARQQWRLTDPEGLSGWQPPTIKIS